METKPNKGGRKKGTPKTGGRKKGTPNKSTQQRRELMQQIVDEGLEYFARKQKQLSDKDRLEVLKMLIPYTVGKAKPYDIETKEAQKGKIITLHLNNGVPPDEFKARLP